MSDFICNTKECPYRNSFGFCSSNICHYARWTDKLSLDYEGNIRDFDGNIVGHYDVGMLQDYTANIPKSIEFVVKDNTDGTK